MTQPLDTRGFARRALGGVDAFGPVAHVEHVRGLAGQCGRLIEPGNHCDRSSTRVDEGDPLPADALRQPDRRHPGPVG